MQRQVMRHQRIEVSRRKLYSNRISEIPARTAHTLLSDEPSARKGMVPFDSLGSHIARATATSRSALAWISLGYPWTVSVPVIPWFT
jgi:hypothetical protein